MDRLARPPRLVVAVTAAFAILAASLATPPNNVTAASLDISGTLQGDVVASGLVAIRSGAVVRGDLRGAEISIEPGSRVSVRLATDFELDLGPDAKRR